ELLLVARPGLGEGEQNVLVDLVDLRVRAGAAFTNKPRRLIVDLAKRSVDLALRIARSDLERLWKVGELMDHPGDAQQRVALADAGAEHYGQRRGLVVVRC